MATNVILPALGMAQESGTIVRWLKAEGEQVTQGEPIAEIETDKATVEIEAPASGMLAAISASAGETVPTGHIIARIVAVGESPTGGVEEGDVSTATSADDGTRDDGTRDDGPREGRHYISDVQRAPQNVVAPLAGAITPPASPLASRIAAEHRLDLSRVQPSGKRIQKADVLTYLQQQNNQGQQGQPPAGDHHPGRTPASPKARRLALEYGVNLAAIRGSGPDGAVLAADVQSSRPVQAVAAPELARPSPAKAAQAVEPIAQGGATTAGMEEPAATGEEAVGTIWRVMAERTTQSWMGTPHFYLVREVDAGRLIAWREQVKQRAEGAGGAGDAETKITYTDLLVKVVAAALRRHARVNASWREGKIVLHDEVHIGLAVAIEQGLVVPVIHQADRLNLREIAARRQEAVALAQAGKLRPADLQGGTFTISNLGMYGVDAFNAIINQPQAAILAVGRIAERVVPLHGQPSVQPMMVLTLSCDHRAIDGARGAQFLATVAELVEEPLGLLD